MTRTAKVSVVGAGMQPGPGFASRMFRTPFEAGINNRTDYDERDPDYLPDRSRVPKAARALSKAFELEG